MSPSEPAGTVYTAEDWNGNRRRREPNDALPLHDATMERAHSTGIAVTECPVISVESDFVTGGSKCSHKKLLR